MIANNELRYSPLKALALLAFSAMALLCFTGLERGLWTPDEPREAEIGREMYLSPSVVPRLNGVSFSQKPPLYYWIVAGLFVLSGGPSVAAARVVSGMAGLATLLVVYVWGSRAASPRTGLLAAVLLMTSSQFFIATQWIRIDVLLMLWCTMAFWAGWELISRKGGWPFALLLHVSLVLSFWTKGLVGPAVVIAGLAALLIVRRGGNSWRRLRPFLGTSVLVLSVAAFAVMMYREGGSGVIWDWMWRNHVQRVFEPQGTGHAKPFYYYGYTLPLSLLPWFLPLALCFRRSFWADEVTSSLRRYCAPASAAGLLLLSVASTKRGIYLLPVIPLLALLMAAAVDHLIRTSASLERCGAALRASIRLQALLAIIYGVSPFVLLVMYTRATTVASILVFFLSVSIAAAGGLQLVRGSIAKISALSAAAVSVALFATTILLVPVADSKKRFDGFVGSIHSVLPTGDPIYAYHADETIHGIVPFLTGRDVIDVDLRLGRKSRQEAGDLPPLLLVHLKNDAELPPIIGSHYREIRSEHVGNRRSLSLWELRKD